MPPLRRAAIALLLLLPVLPACEGPRAIAGRVRDGAGNPVPHARLSAVHLTGASPVGETDSLGYFRFDVFASAFDSRASVQVDAAGYHSRFVRLPFRDGVEVVLTPDSVPLHGRQWADPETIPLGGAHLGIPLRWSGNFGLARGRWASFDDFKGVYLAAESGGGGVKGRLGFVRFGKHLGGQIGVAALRTSSHALTVAPGQGYAGAEARIHFIPLTFTVGGFGRISGSAPGDAKLFAAGVGLGF